MNKTTYLACIAHDAKKPEMVHLATNKATAEILLRELKNVL